MIQQIDVAIIGGGPAGLAAAYECYKNGVEKVVIFERDQELGGILQQCIHNGFGLHLLGEELTGPEYAEKFISVVKDTKIEIKLNTMVLEVTPDRKIYAISAGEGLIEAQAKAVILAMGCRERTRGAIRIPGTRPAGVFTAGTAQRLVNMEGYMPGKRIVILGSGDIGLIMARRMTWEGAKVEMVCEIMPYSSGLTRNIVQCLEDYQIPLRYSTTVTQIHGRERVEGVTIARVDENRKAIPETEEFIPCDTLLLSVGLIPENELSTEAGVLLDPVTGGAVVNEKRQTNIPGIFACGNVLHVHDLVDYVSKEAALTGKAAASFIKNDSKAEETDISIYPGKGIRYVVPQKLSNELRDQTIELYFRVDNVYDHIQLQLRCRDEILVKKKKKVSTPGEMEMIKLPANALAKIKGAEELMVELIES